MDLETVNLDILFLPLTGKNTGAKDLVSLLCLSSKKSYKYLDLHSLQFIFNSNMQNDQDSTKDDWGIQSSIPPHPMEKFS